MLLVGGVRSEICGCLSCPMRSYLRYLPPLLLIPALVEVEPSQNEDGACWVRIGAASAVRTVTACLTPPVAIFVSLCKSKLAQ